MNKEQYLAIQREQRAIKKELLTQVLNEELSLHRAGKLKSISSDHQLSRRLRMAKYTLESLMKEIFSPDDLDYRSHILSDRRMTHREYLRHKEAELQQTQRNQELRELSKCDCRWMGDSVNFFSELTSEEIRIGEIERPGISYQVLRPSLPEILFMRALKQVGLYSSCQAEASPGQCYYPGFGHRNLWFARIDEGRRYKIPDFKVKGQNKAIEVFGDYYHNPDNFYYGSSLIIRNEYDVVPELLIDKYLEVGIDCLVFWEHEVKDPTRLSSVVEDVRSWVSNGPVLER